MARLLVGLHITAHRLHAGLHELSAGIARRKVAADAPIMEIARLQSALGIAVDRLATVALTLGSASETLGVQVASQGER